MPVSRILPQPPQPRDPRRAPVGSASRAGRSSTRVHPRRISTVSRSCTVETPARAGLGWDPGRRRGACALGTPSRIGKTARPTGWRIVKPGHVHAHHLRREAEEGLLLLSFRACILVHSRLGNDILAVAERGESTKSAGSGFDVAVGPPMNTSGHGRCPRTPRRAYRLGRARDGHAGEVHHLEDVDGAELVRGDIRRVKVREGLLLSTASVRPLDFIRPPCPRRR